MLPIEKGRDSEGHLKMVYGLLSVSLATIYPADDLIGLAEQEISALLRGVVDRLCVAHGVLCSAELFVAEWQIGQAV